MQCSVVGVGPDLFAGVDVGEVPQAVSSVGASRGCAVRGACSESGCAAPSLSCPRMFAGLPGTGWACVLSTASSSSVSEVCAGVCIFWHAWYVPCLKGPILLSLKPSEKLGVSIKSGLQ